LEVGDMAWRRPRTSRGYAFDEAVSCLQKSVRRGDEEGACWFTAELDRSGFGGHAWNRLEVICSEDIGPAQPLMPAVIAALRDQYDRQKKRRNAGRPERLMLVHAAMLLARAPKSRRVDHALWASYGTEERRLDVPDHALDMHTGRGRRLGRGVDHFEAEAAVLVNEADLGPDPFEAFYLAGDEQAYDRQDQAGPGQQQLDV
jgi:replication-associated recombination protein RarA